MNNPLLGKVFSLGKLSGLKLIDVNILYHIIYDKHTTISQLIEKCLSSRRAVFYSLSKLTKGPNPFIVKNKNWEFGRNNFIVNEQKIENLWLANRYPSANPSQQTMEVLEEEGAIFAPSEPLEEKAECTVCTLVVQDVHPESAQFAPLYNNNIINNLTRDLSRESVELVVKKEVTNMEQKSDEDLAFDWLTDKIRDMRANKQIPSNIGYHKSNGKLVAEGMYHMLNRDRVNFPKMSQAGKGMLGMLAAGTWRTPTGMTSVAKSEVIPGRQRRAYDEPQREEGTISLDFTRTESQQIALIVGLARPMNLLGQTYKLPFRYAYAVPYLEAENLRFELQAETSS